MHCAWVVAVAVWVAAAPPSKAPKRPPVTVEKKVVTPPPPPPPPKEVKTAEIVPPPQVIADQPGPDASTPTFAFRPYSVGALLGPSFALNGGPTLMRFGGQFEAKLMQLSPTVSLELELPLALGFGSHTVAIAGLFQSTTNFFMMELAPTGQLAVALAPTFDLYGGFGLGPAYASATTSVRFQGPLTSGSGGVVIRLTGGARFRLADTVSLFLEPFGLHIYGMGGTTTRIGGVEVQTSGGSGVMYQLAFGGAYLL